MVIQTVRTIPDPVANEVEMATVAPSYEAGTTAATIKGAIDSKIIFLLGFLLAASGLVSPPVALVGGIPTVLRSTIL